MNREIKFRAWIGELKKVFPVININARFSDENGHRVFIQYPDEEQPKTPRNYLCDGNNNILMQFTGLKDKHDKEIYEGDIIKITSTGDIKKIFYHKCSFGIDLGNNVFAPIYWHEDIEVIGNIYENPDLIP